MDKKQKRLYRSKEFGVVINPITLEELIWSEFSSDQILSKLKELEFPNKFFITQTLNELVFENANSNSCRIEDFEGQLELGGKTNIPHYQLAIKTKSVCTRRKVLDALIEKINGLINVDVQFNFEDMKNYCSKETIFLSEEYSGKIYKYRWKMDFLDRKPQLKEVLHNPYKWQKFFKEEILSKNADDRIVDWLIDPVGNTGKSSFARAYVSNKLTDGILMKIDNLDRMELSLINKIQLFRETYYEDPKVIFFDFPRAADSKKVMAATALMEDAKSGHLETTFGGNHKEIEISNVHVVVLANTAPDLSVLSVDRWRLWRLGGEEYDNIMWPCHLIPQLKKFNKKITMLEWTVLLKNISPVNLKNFSQYDDLHIEEEWFNRESNRKKSKFTFGLSNQYIKDICSTIYESPNHIRLLLMDKLKNEQSTINF